MKIWRIILPVILFVFYFQSGPSIPSYNQRYYSQQYNYQPTQQYYYQPTQHCFTFYSYYGGNAYPYRQCYYY